MTGPASRSRPGQPMSSCGWRTSRLTRRCWMSAAAPEESLRCCWNSSREVALLGSTRRRRWWRWHVSGLAAARKSGVGMRSSDLDEPVDVIVSTATLHWVTDHDRLWKCLAGALRTGGRLEIQCGGEGNIEGVREVIEAAARKVAPQLVGWSPWVFAGPDETARRLREAGFVEPRCWLQERPAYPQDVATFVRTSILAAHLDRLPGAQREVFVNAVAGRSASASGLRSLERLSRARFSLRTGLQKAATPAPRARDDECWYAHRRRDVVRRRRDVSRRP